MAGTALSGRAIGAEADGDGGPHVAWNRTYGDEFWQRARSVVQAPDGGFVVAGETSSEGHGEYAALVVRTDASGELLWERTAGGRDYNSVFSMIRTADGGYAVTGITTDGYPAEPDFRLVRLTADS